MKIFSSIINGQLILFEQFRKSQRLLKEREANGNLSQLSEFKKSFDSTNLLCLNDGQHGDDSDSELNDLDEDLDRRSSILSNEDHLTISNLKSENIKPDSQSSNKSTNSNFTNFPNANSSLMSNLAHHTNNTIINSNSNHNNLMMRLEMNQIANAAVAHALKNASLNSSLKNNLLTNNSSIGLSNSQTPVQPMVATTASSVLQSTALSTSNQNTLTNNKLADKNQRKLIPSLIDNLNMKNSVTTPTSLSSTTNSFLNNPFISSPFMPKFNHSFDALWKQSNQNFLSLRYPFISSIGNNNEG